jgi:ferredoxin-NADP reductase
MNFIDAFLNRITMYRLVLLSLVVLVIVSIGCSMLGALPFTPFSLLFSVLILVLAARISNAAFALFTQATPTPESAYITALILFFILAPVQSATQSLYLALAAVIAMLSKYVFVVGKKHIFNPAAFSVFVFSVFGSGIATWWVATPVLLLFTTVIGLLIVRKLRRFDVFFTFIAVAMIVFIARAGAAMPSGAPLISAAPLIPATLQFLTSFPLIFFGAIMLMDPQTMPSSKSGCRWYAVLVGLLFSLSFEFRFGFLILSATPEFALLVGNLYSFIVGARRRIELSFHSVEMPLKDKRKGVYEYTFVPHTAFRFQPGQYLEWTIPHGSPDKRGIRRYFTISSAPSDPFVRVGIHVPPESSTFKDALGALTKGTVVSAANVAGEFVLPRDPNESVAAIAGGIGITPFMSMFRQLAVDRRRRDIVLIYTAASPLDFAYQDELDSIKDSIGLRVLYLPTDFEELTNWAGPSGFLTSDFIRKEVRDFKTRHWYLSGPTGTVDSYTSLLRALAVPRSSIKTEHFPGF